MSWALLIIRAPLSSAIAVSVTVEVVGASLLPTTLTVATVVLLLLPPSLTVILITRLVRSGLSEALL